MKNDDTNCTGVVVYGNNSLPEGDCTMTSNTCNPCDTGLRKVVSDWIAGGTSRSSVAATYGLIESWDLSEVTNLKCIFYQLSNFNADISKWKTSGVTTLQGSKNHQYLFLYCQLCILLILPISLFYTFYHLSLAYLLPSLSYRHSAFELATAFNADLSQWNVARVVNMEYGKCHPSLFLFF